MKTVNRLSAKDSFRVSTYVQENYVAAGISDNAFAKKASADLGIHLTVNNIAGARLIFDLPSTRLAEKPSSDLERIRKELQEAVIRIAALEASVSNLAEIVSSFRSAARLHTLNGRPSLRKEES